MTIPTRIALAVLANADRELSGYAIIRATELKSGTLYPILTRLLANGYAEARWETDEEWDGEGRPRRKYYTLTATGRTLAKDHGLGEVAQRHSSGQGRNRALVNRLALRLLREFASNPAAARIADLDAYLPELATLGLSDVDRADLVERIYEACGRASITINQDKS